MNPKMSTNALILNSANVYSSTVSKKRATLTNSDMCHLIIVLNCKNSSRDHIMKSILDFTSPHAFVPMCFTWLHRNASFYVKNCKLAIDKLCCQKLTVPNSDEEQPPFQLMIIVGFCNFTDIEAKVKENLMEVLTKLYNSSTKSLNLENFNKNPFLTEYCALSHPNILNFVLYLSSSLKPECLILANNEITTLNSIQVFPSEFQDLKVLDLRNNNIASILEISPIKDMNIIELCLEGNPLCEVYYQQTYIAACRQVCPDLIKLDGLVLQSEGFPILCKNFLCNIQGKELVDQFLEHYFTLFDSPKRVLLGNMYHNYAIFSLTCAYLLEQSTSSQINLGIYKSLHRNLKKRTGHEERNQYLFKGPEDIINVLLKFPLSRHDPSSFTIDLMHYSEFSAVLTVRGVLQESSNYNIMSFTRTFVLAKVSTIEYKIINEQLHISNATTFEANLGFKTVVTPSPKFSVAVPQNSQEKNLMINAFRMITTLNRDWSKKFLEDTGYQLEKSIKTFIGLYEKDEIPEACFLTELISNHFVPEPISPYTAIHGKTKKFKKRQRKVKVHTGPHTFIYVLNVHLIALGLLQPGDTATEIHFHPIIESVRKQENDSLNMSK